MIVLVATYVAREGEGEAIEAALREMIRHTRQEPGCLTYTAQRSVEDPRKYLLYEQYADQAALDAHSNADYFQKYVLGEIRPRLESRVREFYDVVE